MRKKPIHVTRNLIAIPRELINLHKRVFLTADLFFVNKIPFFLTYSRKICCTYVTHLENRKVTTILWGGINHDFTTKREEILCSVIYL